MIDENNTIVGQQARFTKRWLGNWRSKGADKSITIGFTEQRLSPPAGRATFWSWLRPLGWNKLMAGALPQALPLSNNKLLPVEKVLAFMHVRSCDARRLPLRWLFAP